jgi:hypothetical protein
MGRVDVSQRGDFALSNGGVRGLMLRPRHRPPSSPHATSPSGNANLCRTGGRSRRRGDIADRRWTSRSPAVQRSPRNWQSSAHLRRFGEDWLPNLSGWIIGGLLRRRQSRKGINPNPWAERSPIWPRRQNRGRSDNKPFTDSRAALSSRWAS